ncbi:HI1506-related protein [Aquipseudomonas campi]
MTAVRTGVARRAGAKPAAKKSTGPGAEVLPAIYVRSLPETFRRAGHVFTREGHGLLLDDLSKEQLKAIREEPMLSVQECEIPANTEDDELLQQQANSGADSTGGDA